MKIRKIPIFSEEDETNTDIFSRQESGIDYWQAIECLLKNGDPLCIFHTLFFMCSGGGFFLNNLIQAVKK